jgi:hypothetical protein
VQARFHRGKPTLHEREAGRPRGMTLVKCRICTCYGTCCRSRGGGTRKMQESIWPYSCASDLIMPFSLEILQEHRRRWSALEIRHIISGSKPYAASFRAATAEGVVLKGAGNARAYREHSNIIAQAYYDIRTRVKSAPLRSRLGMQRRCSRVLEMPEPTGNNRTP